MVPQPPVPVTHTVLATVRNNVWINTIVTGGDSIDFAGRAIEATGYPDSRLIITEISMEKSVAPRNRYERRKASSSRR